MAPFTRYWTPLFLTHTILFVGYSLSDPDIQLVLENSNIAAQCDHKHYALISDELHPDIEQAAARAYNIHFLKYPKGNHSEAEEALRQLATKVTQFRISNPS